MTSDDAMRIALEEAQTAGHAGDVPVGAVVVCNGEIIARRHNEREVTGDPTHMQKYWRYAMQVKHWGVGA